MSDPAIGVARRDLSAAFELLGKRHLVLAIHDLSFPAGRDDLGRGSPYGDGAAALFTLARELAFTGVQLGPQGLTSRGNPSPYDGAAFSRDLPALALAPLAGPDYAHLLPPDALEAALAGPLPPSERADHRRAWSRLLPALAAAYGAFVRRRDAGDPALRGLVAELAAFRADNHEWLLRDGLYEVLSTSYRSFAPGSFIQGLRVSFDGAHEGVWSGDTDLFAGDAPPALARQGALAREYARELEFLAFGQLLLARQHADLRARLAARGELPALRLFGDLQIGLSVADTWARRRLFLPGYAMGAPPSRTNPAGQPWGYPVLDPRLYFEPDGGPGPALRLVAARAAAMLRDYDGLRIDHPHGLVCPWVYRRDDPDPLRAVQTGARLFDSPDLPDHPDLAALAIARPDQLARDLARHADGWVRALDPEQVSRYSAQLDVILHAARAAGRGEGDVLCEVLSTQPYPLARAMARHGLGRFRVTQKADLTNPRDVYRSENACPEDWVMLGNHDTPPIWLLAQRWHGTEVAATQAAYLAERLRGGPELAQRLERDPAALVHAKFADLLICPARQVMVFMSDLFGLRALYNAPGTVDAGNWSLRLRPDDLEGYWTRAARGEALDLGKALALALRALGRGDPELLARLER